MPPKSNLFWEGGERLVQSRPDSAIRRGRSVGIRVAIAGSSGGLHINWLRTRCENPQLLAPDVASFGVTARITSNPDVGQGRSGCR